MRRRRTLALGAVGCVVIALAGCGSSSSSSGSGPIVIGASVPLSGSLGPLGTLITPGYKIAVAQINAAGGLDVGGKKRKVKLVMLDSRSDPTVGANQIRQLVDQDNAVALFGSVTDLVVQQSAAAEHLQVPYVTSLDPPQIWETQAPAGGWKYAWDFHFALVGPGGAIPGEFAAANTVPTNKRLAVVADNAADGVAWSGLVVKTAPSEGYHVVAHSIFPVGETNFASFINAAKSANAQVLIAQLPPADGIALWKQMAGLGYSPKLAFCEKCANDSPWAAGLGKLANGTLATGQWSPQEGYPGTAQLVSALTKQHIPPPDQYLSAFTYSVAQVVFDAIQRANSTDPAKINAALAQTNKTYTAGHVQFDSKHGQSTPTVVLQWRDGNTYQVHPSVAGSKISPQ